jgi:hypothetical protein
MTTPPVLALPGASLDPLYLTRQDQGERGAYGADQWQPGLADDRP